MLYKPTASLQRALLYTAPPFRTRNRLFKQSLVMLTCFGIVTFGVRTPLFAQEKAASALQATDVAKAQDVRLQLVVAKPSYALGEPIPITMRYTTGGEATFAVRKVDFDRSGRVSDYSFSAVDAAGVAVRDPASQLNGQSRGGPLYAAKLSRVQPFEQEVTVNQWLAFDRPGRYTLRAHSTIVSPGEAFLPRATSLPLDSAPLVLTITGPDEASRRMRLQITQAIVQGKDRESHQTNRQTRFEAVRDLRFMLDKRAIPILVRALSDGWVNVQNEANLALLSFSDLAPVRAELLRILADDTSPLAPKAKYPFLNLLREADSRALKATPQEASATRAASLRYNTLLNQKLGRQLAALPPAEAAESIVEAMREYQMDATSPDNWKRVLVQAAMLSPEVQQRATERLMSVLTVRPNQGQSIPRETLVALRNPLHAIAQNAGVDGTLRLAALLGLHRQGDDSLRDLLFNDAVKQQGQILRLDAGYDAQREAAREVLGLYRTTEIAPQLLKLFLELPAQSSSENFLVWRSLLYRLRDFGGAASTEQLRQVYDKVQKERDGSGDLKRVVIQAVALNSPEEAPPLIRAFPAAKEGTYGARYEVITRLLTRLTSLAARALVDELLSSPDERDRVAVIQGLWFNVEDSRDKYRSRTPFLPPQAALSMPYFPRIVQIFEKDPSPKVRTQAFYALSQLTNIPARNGYDEKNADDKRYISAWKQWLKQPHPETANLGP